MSDPGEPTLPPFQPPEDEYEDAPPGSRDAGAPDPTPSAINPTDMRRRRVAAKERVNAILKFWIAALGTQGGRAALWEFLEAAHIRESRFACGPNGFPQPDATWFELGQKSMGEWLQHKLMTADYDGYGRMLREHHPDFQAPARRRSK